VARARPSPRRCVTRPLHCWGLLGARRARACHSEHMRTIEVIRRHEQLALGRNDVQFHRDVRKGRLLRIAPGRYVHAAEWEELSHIERHRVRVLEYSQRLHPDTVFSHFAAASLWGIRLLGAWPDSIHVIAPSARGGRSEGHVVRHCTAVDASGITTLDGMRLTTPAQTAVDLARTLPFADAVVAMDSALGSRRRPSLTSEDAIASTIDGLAGRRGRARAVAVSAFATPFSDSPQESHSRVLIHTLGFPRPELQRSFTLPNGLTAEVDFYWDDFKHAGECDGRSKYRDPEFLKGRRPEDVVIAEKNRENQLRRVVGQVSRWEPAELYTPQSFYDHLVRDGLPSTRPRPGRAG